jgi:hypothetical protein
MFPNVLGNTVAAQWFIIFIIYIYSLSSLLHSRLSTSFSFQENLPLLPNLPNPQISLTFFNFFRIFTFQIPNLSIFTFPSQTHTPSSHVCTMREAYLQKQEGIDSQQRRQRENEIERDLWQNFDLSKTQRFDPYPSNHSHVLHCLVVGIIGAKILSCCQPKMVAVKKLWGGTKMPPRRERDRDRDRKNE